MAQRKLASQAVDQRYLDQYKSRGLNLEALTGVPRGHGDWSKGLPGECASSMYAARGEPLGLSGVQGGLPCLGARRIGVGSPGQHVCCF